VRGACQDLQTICQSLPIIFRTCQILAKFWQATCQEFSKNDLVFTSVRGILFCLREHSFDAYIHGFGDCTFQTVSVHGVFAGSGGGGKYLGKSLPSPWQVLAGFWKILASPCQ